MSEKKSNIVFHRSKPGIENCVPDAWDDLAVIKAYDMSISNTNPVTTDMSSFQVKVTNDVIPSRKIGEVVWSRESGVEVVPDPQANKSDVKSRLGKKKKRKRVNKNQRQMQISQPQWKVGDSCMALYQEDQLFYRATVKVLNNTQGTVVVEYDDWDEDEVLAIKDILPEYMWNEVEGGGEDGQVSVENMPIVIDNSASKSNRKRRRNNAPFSSSNDNGISIEPPPFLPTLNGVPNNIPKADFSNISADLTNLSKEALSNMLVSWYMAGYHTGYYRGLTSSSDQNN